MDTVTDALHGGYHLAPHFCEVATVINYLQIQVRKLRLTRFVQGHIAKAGRSDRIGLNINNKHRT